MRVIHPDGFVTMLWKNGGGITREIARVSEDDRILWRLSMAEVASDGPFSAFPGLTRILTVIRGAGLVLRTPLGVMTAEPMQPVRFSGDLPVDCTRIAGDVTDLNVIFDGDADCRPRDTAGGTRGLVGRPRGVPGPIGQRHGGRRARHCRIGRARLRHPVAGGGRSRPAGDAGPHLKL